MITINLFNVAVLIIVGLAIWGCLPQEYKEELGSLIGWGIELVWLIVWIIIFPVLGYSISFG